MRSAGSLSVCQLSCQGIDRPNPDVRNPVVSKVTRAWGDNMYKTIMAPVDLAHVERLGKALTTAADLSKHYGIPVCYVGVTATTPGPVAHTPAEFTAKLEHFARAQADKYGLQATAKAYTSHDPAVDLDDTLLKAIAETGADLVVMASHIPGIPDYIFSSNAGYLASHAKVTVMVVR